MILRVMSSLALASVLIRRERPRDSYGLGVGTFRCLALKADSDALDADHEALL
jgi:hypothetical protein